MSSMFDLQIDLIQFNLLLLIKTDQLVTKIWVGIKKRPTLIGRVSKGYTPSIPTSPCQRVPQSFAVILYKKIHFFFQVLQATTRDSLGLPRLPGEHPGVKWVRIQLAFALLGILAQIPHSLMLKFTLAGSINTFPNSVTVPLALIMPLLLAQIGIPCGMMWVEPSFRKFVARELIRCFEDLKEAAYC